MSRKLERKWDHLGLMRENLSFKPYTAYCAVGAMLFSSIVLLLFSCSTDLLCSLFSYFSVLTVFLVLRVFLALRINLFLFVFLIFKYLLSYFISFISSIYPSPTSSHTTSLSSPKSACLPTSLGSPNFSSSRGLVLRF